MLSSRCVAFAGLLLSAGGARVRRGGGNGAAKYIEGVPVLNYHLAYTGKTSLAEEHDEMHNSKLEEKWLVMLDPTVPEEQLHRACAVAHCAREGHAGSVPFLQVKGSEGLLAKVLQACKGAAKFVEPDVTTYLEPDPYDGLPRPASLAAASGEIWGLKRIGASKRSATGKGVHVYVLDTGLFADHEDFGGRASVFADMYPSQGGSEGLCRTADCAHDDNGHGTHCAGTVGGSTYGVAPDAFLHGVKVLGPSGGSTSAIVQGMDFVLEIGKRPAVASMSLGGPGKAAAYEAAVDALSDGGIAVVVAAGNDYADACNFKPAYIPRAITVGSTESGDKRSGFSNFGTCLDIWAPGSDILSASHTDASGTAMMSGTSMACPHVSGAFALQLEKDPTLPPKALLREASNSASVNYITELSPEDENNLLLYVGADGAPAPQSPPPQAPWPSDEFFASCGERRASGPSYHTPYGSYCSCRQGTCYEGSRKGCTLTPELDELNYGGRGLELRYFAAACKDCRCKSSWWR